MNREQLALYFGIGRYISEHSRKGYWGTGAIESISEQLQRELPGLRGFGARQLKNMRQFYEAWMPVLSSMEHNLAATAAEIRTDEFLGISFTHHVEILSKTKELAERTFYIHQSYVNSWDKYSLREMLKADPYHHQGSMPNNFAKTLPAAGNAIRAIEMFKDEYLLDFINVEEIGARDEADVDEREVEQAIVSNVKNFIMTFGRDFTFVGNQYHLRNTATTAILICFSTIGNWPHLWL